MVEQEKELFTLQNCPFTYQKGATYIWQVIKVNEFIDSLNKNKKDWPLEVSLQVQYIKSEKH